MAVPHSKQEVSHGEWAAGRDTPVSLGETPAVPKRAPAPMGPLLDAVLGDVARRTGSGGALWPVWREVAGALVARHAAPRALEAGTLFVSVDDERWRTELEAQAGALLERLSGRLGRGKVERLVFELR